MDDNIELRDYVTFATLGQTFGLPIGCVQDVFRPQHITPVPLAGAEIAGVLNLRGRIVTAIDLRARLGLGEPKERPSMAIGIEHRGESFGLLVDSVGEVLKLSDERREPIPINLDRKLTRVAAGVFRLAANLLVILNVDRVLELGAESAVA